MNDDDAATERESEKMVIACARTLAAIVDKHVEDWCIRDEDDVPMRSLFQSPGLQRILIFQKNLGEAVARLD